jgi:PIN domain nuclease of toxin-antitoxin system
MRLLLDTHLFIWAITDSSRLAATRGMIVAADSVYISAASIWEIIKSRLGKIKGDPQAMADVIEQSGFIELPVSARHAARVAKLPAHHRDPFDRILIAQAMSEPLLLLTADRGLAKYGDLVLVI